MTPKLKDRLAEGKSAWKFWGGRMAVLKTLLGERRKPGLITALPARDNHAPSSVGDLLALERGSGSSFNLDAAARRGALDRGLAANEAKRATDDVAAARPALELLAAIGLSAFFPPRRIGGHRESGPHGTAGFDGERLRYCLWGTDAPLPLARLLARGVEGSWYARARSLRGAAHECRGKELPIRVCARRRIGAGHDAHRVRRKRRKRTMPEQKQVDVKADAWDSVLDEDKGPAAIVIRERLRPAAGVGSPVAPPTFAGRGQGDSDYNYDGEDPRNWESVLKAKADGRVANRCTLDSIPSQANRMESMLKRFEGRYIPKVTLTGSKHGAMSLLDVGHRVADAALWSSDGYSDFQTALEAYVQGNALKLAKIAPTSLVLVLGERRSRGERALPRELDDVLREDLATDEAARLASSRAPAIPVPEGSQEGSR
jgi:CRISPR-associated protein Csb1